MTITTTGDTRFCPKCKWYGSVTDTGSMAGFEFCPACGARYTGFMPSTPPPEEIYYHIKEIHYRDLYGNLIWKDNIVFRRLWGIGNELVHDFKTYIVRRVAVADDVEHVNIELVQPVMAPANKNKE